MHKKNFAIPVAWSRWSKYEILNGVVVPAKDGELIKHNPWSPFAKNQGQYRTVQQPYTSLLDLNSRLVDLEKRGTRVTRIHGQHFRGPEVRGPQNEADELILDRCNKYGLLGLVQVLSNSIRLRSTVESGLFHPNTGVARGSGVVVHRRHYSRDGGMWSEHNTRMNTTHDGSKEIPAEEPPPEVDWFVWKRNFFEPKPISHIREYFLPTPFGAPAEVIKDVEIPIPGSEEFWSCYGEPLVELVTWVNRFAETVEYICAWDGKNPTTVGSQVGRAYWAMAGLAQSAAPWFRFDDETNQLFEDPALTGLLALYAMMFLRDRTNDRRVLRCSNCTKVFVSDEKRAEYCSTTCRNTAQSRRYRLRKQAEKEQGR